MKKMLLLLISNVLVLPLFAQNPDTRVEQLRLQLPPVSAPMANYVRAVRSGNLVFLAGHGPTRADGTTITGKVGSRLTVEEGYEAARITALSLLATLREALGGSLNRVKRIVKVNGYVNCGPDFGLQPQVINGCSDLLVAVFGEKGKHARAAMGMVSLPNQIAVEIEMIVEVED
ncbi:MAG TPA: RidA family protein [Lacibacter sp.]|nr:RidA family protein [Lacibacter sp.]HMO90108.1 RidA family protein [Lacibacter sp.]HMP85735.1 RidA family protein [Lacibacter sp.]